MVRPLTSGMVSEVTSDSTNLEMLIELQFDSGTLRFWTGDYELTWDGKAWTAGGLMLGISKIEESEETKASKVMVTLTGQDPALISIAHTETYQGRTAIIYMAAFDDADVVIADPDPWFTGLMDVMEDADDGESARFTLSLVNRLIILDYAAERRYTPEDQKLDFPPTGSPEDFDRGFDQVTSLQGLEIVLE